MPLPRKKALFPADCEMQLAFLSMQFDPGTEEHFPTLADYQVRVEGWVAAEKALFELQDHWRIDTHAFEPKSPSGADEDNGEPHPMFHFQRGGHQQDDFASVPTFVPGSGAAIEGELRGLFQTPGPRMPALPLDPVLAIDFCIGQANGRVWSKLRNIPEYFSLVEEAQQRTWQPFFRLLATPEFQRRWLGPFVI